MDQDRQMLGWLRGLIENNRVVIFMKGERHFPLCRLSNAALHLLKLYGKPFETVNVLRDPAIGRVLAQYSDCPLLPQVYIAGKFIGDCDRLVEMHQSGELEPLIEAAFDES